jgi:DNA-binding FadR family transcriptional regulator
VLPCGWCGRCDDFPDAAAKPRFKRAETYLVKARSINLTDHVAGELGRSIVSGQYSAGAVFQVNDLCVTFGASRTVMREAVKALTAKGLVTSRASIGNIVSPEEAWNLSDPDVLSWFLHAKGTRLPLIREFNDFRIAIEPTAAALAAARGDVDAIAKIFAALDRMRAAERGEDDSLDADVAFHVAILHASGNRFFVNMRHTIDVALHISIRVTNRQKAVAVASAADHAKVADAIRAGNSEGAHAAMLTLLVEARQLLKEPGAA